ncbi:hypothetical protein DFH01_06800 [Falsiroseomonas bella]|uniref:Uncharacterized protein n=1 Tax=Falsiroseomonas bella TaxID=2184016 RepID=A0A317FNA4_9PROT|nr:hypothetical protein DFH01_06800 [Falsiroseomonas bella]
MKFIMQETTVIVGIAIRGDLQHRAVRIQRAGLGVLGFQSSGFALRGGEKQKDSWIAMRPGRLGERQTCRVLVLHSVPPPRNSGGPDAGAGRSESPLGKDVGACSCFVLCPGL